MIGSLFREGFTPREVLANVSAGDLYFDAHIKIFRVWVELTTAGIPFELVSVFEALKAHNWIADVGGPAYLGELHEAAPTAANFIHHARIVRGYSARRQLIHIAAEITRDAYSPVGSPEELRDRLLERAASISRPVRQKRFKFISNGEFMKGDYRSTWLIKNMIVKGEPGVIGGPSKMLKSSFAVDAIVSLAAGVPFLDRFEIPSPTRVAIVSGESGKSTLQTLTKRVIQAKGLEEAAVENSIYWEFELPILSNPGCVIEFVEDIAEIGVSLVVLDPLYLMLGDTDATNMCEVGPALSRVSQLLLSKGITPILVHHANKQLAVGQVMVLTDLAYSGLEQFTRQFLLINRREKYQSDGNHKLWMNVGGSAGHCGQFGVDVEEGILDEHFGGRFWRVHVDDAANLRGEEHREEMKAQKDRDKERKEEEKILEAIDVERPAATKTAIKDLSSIKSKPLTDAIQRLLDRGVLEPYEWDKAGGNGSVQKCKGYRRAVDYEQTERPVQPPGPTVEPAVPTVPGSCEGTVGGAVPFSCKENGPYPAVPEPQREAAPPTVTQEDYDRVASW